MALGQRRGAGGGVYLMFAGLCVVGVDTAVDAVNWGNISDTDGEGVNSDQTITGFGGAPVTIRATISSTGGSGSVARVYVVKNSVDGDFVAIADGNTVDASVSAGDALHYKATIGSGGPKTCTVTVTNLSGGATLDTFTVSIQI